VIFHFFFQADLLSVFTLFAILAISALETPE
jgi:hypothetical protein